MIEILFVLRPCKLVILPYQHIHTHMSLRSTKSLVYYYEDLTRPFGSGDPEYDE
jgi:hypothetical protein